MIQLGDSVEKSISEGAMDTRTLLSVEHRYSVSKKRLS